MNEQLQEIIKIHAQKGGLLTQAQTARIFGVDPARITQMIKEKKIESVTCLGVRMVTIASIIACQERKKR